MSPRKLTEDDKQEILKQYRNSEATTSTLAKSYEVSSSTISRFLKNKLSTTEYEDLIQQKRLARTPRGEKSGRGDRTKTKKTKASSKTKLDKAKSGSKSKTKKTTRKRKTSKAGADEAAMPELAVAASLQETVESGTAEPTPRRRRRRRTNKAETAVVAEMAASQTVADSDPASEPETEPEAKSASNKLVLEDVPSKSERLILKNDKPDLDVDDEDEDEMDMSILTEMLGEDLEDINDDEDEDEDEDWDDEAANFTERAAALSDVQILPLSQAAMPKICYLVIDRSAELIVKPLAEFADLGVIPEAETRERTLPVFDNHRIAKRFSHRRERVIKVPDGRMLQKTSHHLQHKGITRLLIDGQIYSLSVD